MRIHFPATVSAVGVDETPVHGDGGLVDPDGLAAVAQRTTAYVGAQQVLVGGVGL